MVRHAKIILIAVLLPLFPVCGAAGQTLSWQDCVKEAAQNHPDLISAKENIKAKESAKTITASALYPQINSDLSASTTKTGSQTSDSYGYGVSASQLIFDGFKTSANIKAGEENIKAAEQAYQFTSSEVRLLLRTAFIDLWNAQELLKITKEISKIRRDNLVLISLRYESGMEHKGALLTAEANVAQANFEIDQAERELAVAQQELSRQMGRSELSPLLVEEDLRLDAGETEKPDFEKLAAENPSFKQLVAEKNMASLNVGSARAEFFPTLSASGGADKNGSHWPPEDSSWSTGLTLSLPLFEGGKRLAQVSQARALFKQAQAEERSGRDGIILTLEQGWASLQDASETVGVRKKFLEAAQERAKIAEAQYSLGLIKFDDWIIIENDLVAAKKTFLDARTNALLAQANWAQAKGEVLEYAQK